MSDLINFSIKRSLAITNKEFIKIKLDPTSLVLILAIPILQIILFGYAVEFFPKNLPTAVVNYDNSPYTRRLIQALQSTNYFEIIYGNVNEEDAKKYLKEGKINYVITIPPRFTKDFVRGNTPHVLLEADASAPGIMGGPIQAVGDLQDIVFAREFNGALDYLKPSALPYVTDVHAIYNPNLKTTIAVIPALIGVILMLSLTLVSATTIVEEKEAGNIEVLLNSRIRPLEIMIGKFLAFLVIGYIQLLSVLFVAGYLLFDLPLHGNIGTYLLASFPFLMSNIMLGITSSTISANQIQATQMVTFFFLPSFLLSGFLFPFYGMPYWAQVVGNMLPLTHYISISSGLILKGYTWVNIMHDLWPIILFCIVVTVIAIYSFKRTLD